MTHVVQAGAEELIWIVVGVFWVIAQIAGGAAKKKRTPPRPVSGDENHEPSVPSRVEGAEDPFANLMRKLAGVQEFKIPTPPEPVEMPVKAARSERLAPPKTSKSISRATPPAEPHRAEPAIEVAEVDIRPTMSSFRSAMPVMKLPAMKLSFQPSGKSSGNVPILGKIINPADKQTLRRAMLSHIVLGKPRGLESRDWNEGILE